MSSFRVPIALITINNNNSISTHISLLLVHAISDPFNYIIIIGSNSISKPVIEGKRMELLGPPEGRG